MLKGFLYDGKNKKLDYCDSCTLYLGAIIVLLVGQFIAGLAAGFMQSKYPGIASDGIFNTVFMIILQLLTAAFVILFAQRKERSINFSYVGEGTERKKPHPLLFILPIFAAVAVMSGMFLPTMWYSCFTREVIGIPPEHGQIDLSTTSSVVMLVVASVFLAPICEETIYRGVLYSGLKSEMSAVKAILLSSLAFVFMHMNIDQIVLQFALGVVSAVIMYYGGRLISCIILHAASNSLALIIELTPLGDALGAALEWMTGHIAAAVFITLGFFIVACAVMFGIVVLLKKYSPAPAPVPEPQQQPPAEEQTQEWVEYRAKIAKMRKTNGKSRYVIAMIICVALLVFSAVVSVFAGSVS